MLLCLCYLFKPFLLFLHGLGKPVEAFCDIVGQPDQVVYALDAVLPDKANSLGHLLQVVAFGPTFIVRALVLADDLLDIKNKIELFIYCFISFPTKTAHFHSSSSIVSSSSAVILPIDLRCKYSFLLNLDICGDSPFMI